VLHSEGLLRRAVRLRRLDGEDTEEENPSEAQQTKEGRLRKNSDTAARTVQYLHCTTIGGINGPENEIRA